MAIADTITSMQTHTSNAYTMIGYGTDLTGINKNLANLSSTIFEAFLESLRNPDTLFTNLPKKSGSGSNITLNDTANAPMRITLQPTELTQAGTPTPSSPQDIHTISGSNKVVVCGKNLLSGVEQGTLDSSGQPTSSSTAIRSKNYDLVEPSTQYTFSMNGTTGGVNVAEYTNNKTFISYTFSGGTFTTSATTRYIKISKTATTSDLFQIELGNQATTYTPYVSQEADIDLGYDNLFNYKTICDNATYIPSNDSQIVINRSAGSWGQMLSNAINLKAGTYTLSFKPYLETGSAIRFSVYNATGSTNIVDGYYDIVNGQKFTNTFTLSSDMNIKFCIMPRVSSTGPLTIEEIMLNEGSTAKPYTEYGKAIDYSKIGSYEDKFIRTSGKNLFDINNVSYQSSNTPKVQDDTLVANSPTAWSSALYTITGLKKNTDYSISSILTRTSGGAYSQIFYGTSADQSLAIKNYLSSITTSGAYTTSFNTGNYDTITISFCTSANSSVWTLSNIIVNEGTTALPYEPYGSNEWYIKKNIGKVVLDGSETWNRQAMTSGSNFYTNISNAIQNSPKFYNNMGVYRTYGSSEANVPEGSCFISNAKNLNFLDNRFDNANDFKTALGTNNMILYIPLATPTYTQITGTLANQLEQVYKNMLSQTGQTNISQVNNDLSFNMSVLAIEEV